MYSGLKLNHPFVPCPAAIAAVGRHRSGRGHAGPVHVREEKRMLFVTAQPQALAAAAGTLQGIGPGRSILSL